MQHTADQYLLEQPVRIPLTYQGITSIGVDPLAFDLYRLDTQTPKGRGLALISILLTWRKGAWAMICDGSLQERIAWAGAA